MAKGSRKKRDPSGTITAAAGGGGGSEATATFNGNSSGSEVPTWARWPHPRPESYYGGPYNAYDWAHAWPSHLRDANFSSDFGGFPPPRAGFPPYPAAMQPGGSLPPSSTPPPPPAAGSPQQSSNPESQQSEGSSFSEAVEDPSGDPNKQRRKRKSSDKSSSLVKVVAVDAAAKADGKNNGSKDSKGKQSAAVGDENTAKNKRYGIEEVRDLVRFRTELQAKFETMSTHLELWTSIGEKMSERGHPRRQWESYRDKWDIELRRYQKELKVLLAQAGLVESKELEHPEQLIFTDETLQEIHNRLNLRPKAALRSRFQSGVGGARGCLGEENAREVAGKRMKKTANTQLLVETIVDKVVEKIGTFDDSASAQGFREVLDAVVNLTNVLLADVNHPPPQPGHGFSEFEIDDKVFDWLKGIGKEQYASHFAASHVDWTNLMLLDKDDLMEMKIPVGPRKFILRELDKLRSASSSQELIVQHNQSHSLTDVEQDTDAL